MKKIFFIILILLTINLTALTKENPKEIEHEKNKTEYLNINWWKNYDDDILLNHLAELYRKNYDLKNAEIKIKENEKLVRMQFASELPQISFDGSLSRDFRSSVQQFGSLSIPSYTQNNFLLPLTASYEIDIWGKNRLKTKSLNEALEITKQLERATYISLTSDFSSDYFNLIKADKLLNIQNELIKTQEDILSKTKEKYKTGLCTINEVLVEEKLLTSMKEEKNKLTNNQEVLINSLKAYLTMKEGSIERKNFDEVKLIANIPDKFDTDIINSRPDFLEQEANIKRMGYDVRIARKELLPSFIIYGQIGLNSYHFSDLFQSSTQLANAGIMPSFDIFTGGRKLSLLKLKKYQYDRALNDYQKTIVEDIKEVNNALIEFKTSKNNYKEALERSKLQNKIYNIAFDKEQIGTASKLDILYSKENNLLVQKDLVSNKINYLISTISLYKSTGGKNLLELNKNETL